MLPFWRSCGLLFPLLVLSFAQDHCGIQESHNQYNESSVLKTLKCYNNYHSHVYCSWEEDKTASSQVPLALYYRDPLGDGELQCEPMESGPNANRSKLTVQCQFQLSEFSFRIISTHYVYFKAPCPSQRPEAMRLAGNIRIRVPVNLSEQAVEGGRRLLTWSSPYPQSSSLTSTLTYQVNYRSNQQGDWTVVETNDTQVTVEAEALRPGAKHQARVRAQGPIGLWSKWSPLVTWLTEGPPSVECALDNDTLVTCSWEVNRNLAQILTYQLYCGDIGTAPNQTCCANPVVRARPGDPMLVHSCTFPVRNPEGLAVELVPTRHNSRTFTPYKNIRPDRPADVRIESKNQNWFLKWKTPQVQSLQVSYEVHYWSINNPKNITVRKVQGAQQCTIPWMYLSPSDRYRVQVRALVIPGEGDTFEGIPSEWTDPLEWTSEPREASWSFSTFIYVVIAVVVVVIFLALYAFIPACHRRMVLWEVSVPTPFKSKVLEEVIMNSHDGSFFSQRDRNEKTFICSLQGLEIRDHVRLGSTCSSDDSLWTSQDVTRQFCSVCSDGISLSSSSGSPPVTDTSGLSFSGPYIFCGDSSPTSSCPPRLRSPCEASDHALSVNRPSSTPVLVSCDDYVAWPPVTCSRPMGDLPGGLTGDCDHSHGNGSTDDDPERAESELCPPATTPSPAPSCPLPSENEDPPPEYTPPTTGPFTMPSLGPSFHTTGYCFLPGPEATGWDLMQPPGPPEGVTGETGLRQGEGSLQNNYVRLLNLRA